MNEEWLTQSKIFLEHAQTILPAKEIFVQFHRLSSYRNELYRKRPCIETNGFLWDKMEPSTSADLSLVDKKHLEKDFNPSRCLSQGLGRDRVVELISIVLREL